MVILPHNCDRWSGFLAFVFVYQYLAIDPLELFQHSLSLPEFLPALNQLVILLSKCQTALTRNNQVGGNTTARLLVLHWSGQQPSKFVVDCSQSLIAFNGISRHKFPVIIGANQDIDSIRCCQSHLPIQGPLNRQSQLHWFCLAKANRLLGSSPHKVPIPGDFVLVNTVLRHRISVYGKSCPRRCWYKDFQN